MKKLLFLLVACLNWSLTPGQSSAQPIKSGFKISPFKIVTNKIDAAAICEDCNDRRFQFNAPSPQVFALNNSISFSQPVLIVTNPPKTIKSIKADLVYFEMIPDDDLCFPCNKDGNLYGHFANATNSINWDGPQTLLSITISTPITPCCGTRFRWCIRYLVEFSDCTVCTRLVCYELRKEGCNSPERVITGNGTPFLKSN